MLPSIASGSKVTIHKADFAGFTIGDVIAVDLEDRLLIHRVAWRDRSMVVTAGDNLPLLDPPVGEERFVGVVKAPRKLQLRSVNTHHKPCGARPIKISMVLPPGASLPAEITRSLPTGVKWRHGDADTLGRPAANDVKRFRVGISAAGKATFQDLAQAWPTISAPVIELFVGWRFGGGPNLERFELLDPAVARFHVRLRPEPHVELPLESVAREVGALLWDLLRVHD
jgi:hypothetical protein